MGDSEQKAEVLLMNPEECSEGKNMETSRSDSGPLRIRKLRRESLELDFFKSTEVSWHKLDRVARSAGRKCDPDHEKEPNETGRPPDWSSVDVVSIKRQIYQLHVLQESCLNHTQLSCHQHAKKQNYIVFMLLLK